MILSYFVPFISTLALGRCSSSIVRGGVPGGSFSDGAYT